MSTLSANQSVRITKRLVDSTPAPASGQTFIRDNDLKGFGLRITSTGAKSFVVERRIDGRVRRITLGRYGVLTCEEARREAQKVLGKVAMGINPLAERETAKVKATTLNEAFNDFLRARKQLKPGTRYDYERVMAVAFTDWQSRPLVLITKDAVARRHRELGENRGHAYANLSMRVLRAVLNFARERYEQPDGGVLLAQNPVDYLTRTRGWYRIKRRQRVITQPQLPAWYQAVEALRNTGEDSPGALVADCLTLLLFTGLRREEALGLTWDMVDLEARTLLIPEPKNHEPLLLPLSGFLVALLQRRQARAINHYVFPGRDGVGHFVEPRNYVKQVIATSGIEFSPHDLRRTFITVAESLDVSPYALKRLVNHKTGGDVTAGYIVNDVERLRKPMELVTRFLCETIGAPA